jgi:S1-C subfamily serine protease
VTGPERRITLLLLLLAVTATAGLILTWQRLGIWPSPLHAAATPRPVTARGELAPDEQATVELFERTAPSVVYVTNLALRRGAFGFNLLEVPQGTGSGVVWDDAGDIVTNLHVLQNAQAAEVTLADGSSWRARLVGLAGDKDLAVIRIEAARQRLHPILIGSSHDLKVGQKVFAIGNPFGLDHTLTTGVISALDRAIPAPTPGRTIRGVIQTDAVINPGNSGGPLLDSAGRLVGVNTAIFNPPERGTGTSIGIGFAVPVDTVNRVVPQLIAHGRVVRPGLGADYADDRQVQAWGLAGALVTYVTPGGAGEKAGLQPTTRDELGRLHLGDLIVAIDGRAVGRVDDLLNQLEARKVGDRVAVTVRRGAVLVTLTVELQPAS